MIATRRRFLTLASVVVVAGGNGPSSVWAQEAVPDGSTIVIVRHADKKSGSGDVPLSSQGKKRAEALSETLRDAGISTIITTNALRARQTAKPLAEALRLTPVEITRGDAERIRAFPDQFASYPAAAK